MTPNWGTTAMTTAMEIPSITAAVQTVAFMGVALPIQLCDHQRPKNERDQDKSGGGLAFQVFLTEEFQNHQQRHENHQKPVDQSHHGFSPFIRVLKNKHRAVSQGVRRFEKRSIFHDM
jgi:hypothetical protein